MPRDDYVVLVPIAGVSLLCTVKPGSNYPMPGEHVLIVSGLVESPAEGIMRKLTGRLRRAR